MKKILITGGHTTPALAFVDYLKENKPEIKVIYVGEKTNNNFLSFEFKEVSKRKIKFIDYQTGKLKRELTIENIKNVFLFVLGIIKALKILIQEKPDAILSFGSYLGLPFCFAGFLIRIPVFIHEQTLVPGLANKISSYFSKKIFIAFKEVGKCFNQKKVIFTGNPVREEIFRIINKPFEIKKSTSVIYVTGGSLGSHSLNRHIYNLLPKLLKDYIIIHQTGEVKGKYDYQTFLTLKDQLDQPLKERYFFKPHFLSDELGYIYSMVDLIISRAGANTFFELITLKKPAILVPLPWSVGKEQERHARLFEREGLGKVFFQNEPSSKLYQTIKDLLENLAQYKKNYSQVKILPNKNPSQIIYEEIFEK